MPGNAVDSGSTPLMYTKETMYRTSQKPKDWKFPTDQREIKFDLDHGYVEQNGFTFALWELILVACEGTVEQIIRQPEVFNDWFFVQNEYHLPKEKGIQISEHIRYLVKRGPLYFDYRDSNYKGTFDR